MKLVKINSPKDNPVVDGTYFVYLDILPENTNLNTKRSIAAFVNGKWHTPGKYEVVAYIDEYYQYINNDIILGLVKNVFSWQKLTFDTSAGQAMIGLKREVRELIEADRENELEEIVDCLFYLIYITNKIGFSTEDVIAGMIKKLEINSERNWKKLPDGTYRHI